MPAPNTVDPKQFVKTQPRYLINAYGQDLLEMNSDALNGVFHNTLGGALDQAYLHATYESREIKETVESQRDILEVFQQSFEKLAKDGSKPPPPEWVINDVKFQEKMQSTVTGDFQNAFNRHIDKEKQGFFNECLDKFGPKSFGQLKEKLAQVEDRKGALNGLLDDLNEVFVTNQKRIKTRFGIDNIDDIIAVGGPKPFGNDILEIGKVVLEALRNPELSPVDLFNVKSAADFREQRINQLQPASALSANSIEAPRALVAGMSMVPSMTPNFSAVTIA